MSNEGFIASVESKLASLQDEARKKEIAGTKTTRLKAEIGKLREALYKLNRRGLQE